MPQGPKLYKEPTIESSNVYKGKILALRVDTVRLQDGRVSYREIVEHPGAVAIVALDKQNQVVLVTQYRKAANEFLLEIPAGTLEPRETPEACARRELEEETGYRTSHLVPVGHFFTAPGFCTEVIYTFLARGLKKGTARPDEGEEINTKLVPLTQVPNLIKSGEIHDGKSIASLLMVLNNMWQEDL
jgi:ADP-ribose pyrophosphatase